MSNASWINVILGVWLIVAPWVVGFSNVMGATWTSVITGIVVAIIALWAALGEHAPMAR